jgi:hypothetical protein
MSKPINFRGAADITSASAHPELVSGDLAIPPRPYVSVTSMNRSVASAGSRRTLGMFAVFAVVALLSMIISRSSATSADVDADKQKLARTCLQWHLAASAVVSRQVQSTRDVDLLFVSNSIDRMRRARRNCELGEVEQACEDYHAVASGLPGFAMINELFPCARIAAVSAD